LLRNKTPFRSPFKTTQWNIIFFRNHHLQVMKSGWKCFQKNMRFYNLLPVIFIILKRNRKLMFCVFYKKIKMLFLHLF
jgi:hypothetical protein